jgi:hypothetical protein
MGLAVKANFAVASKAMHANTPTQVYSNEGEAGVRQNSSMQLAWQYGSEQRLIQRRSQSG